MISGKKVSLTYNAKNRMIPILKEVSFELKKGRMTTFMGQSGAGKTTLLKCIANLHASYEGIITYEEKNIKEFDSIERASTIGFVLQQFHLFPHLTVLKNCTYALLQVLKIDKDEAEERTVEILRLLGMLPFSHFLPKHLSGGQQQRVAIARALTLQPKVLLLDEPTSALDPESKKSLESLLLDLNSRGLTLAFSSHDMAFIQRMMDDIYFMEQGTIVEHWDCASSDLASKEKINHFLSYT